MYFTHHVSFILDCQTKMVNKKIKNFARDGYGLSKVRFMCENVPRHTLLYSNSDVDDVT